MSEHYSERAEMCFACGKKNEVEKITSLAREKIAREKFKMVKPGERVFKITD